MKKLIMAIALCLINVVSMHSQISADVEVVEKKYEIITYCHSTHSKIMQFFKQSWKEEGFYLVVSSDNQYEDYKVYVKLGTNEQQTIESLRNISAIYTKVKETNEHFKLDGYTCFISGNRIYFAKPQYKAGYYYIEPTKFNQLADECEKEYNENGRFLTIDERKNKGYY